MTTVEEECPVCRDKIQEPSQPTPCCGKVICQSCMSHSLQYRAHCPHCRGQINTLGSNLSCPNGRRVRRTILPRVREMFSARTPVGTNIQNTRGQLHVAHSRHTASLPYQIVPMPAFTFAPPVPPPQRNFVLTPAPALVAQPHPTPAQGNLEVELEEWPWQTEITLMETRQQQQFQGSRTFACPYCQNDGFDELGLRDHCNAEHANDSRRVVCPVCASMPHGDPTYCSRNFIGHINLRHSFCTEDVTNINQSDEINIQCALMASYARHNPSIY